MGLPAQQAAKTTRPLMPAAAPAVLLLSLDTQQGVSNIILAMTRRDFGKPAFSLRKNMLRENTCTIASGDYSTPFSQRMDVLIEFTKTLLEHQNPADKLKELAGLVDDVFQLMPSGKHMVGRDLGRIGSTTSLCNRVAG